MDFFSKRIVPNIAPAAVVALACANGGRGDWQLAVYLTITCVLFFATFRETPLPKTPLDVPIAVFFAVCLVSAAVHFPSGFRGLEWLCVLLAYILNFYSFLALKDVALTRKILATVLILGFAMGSALIAFQFINPTRNLFFPNINLLSSFLNCALLASVAELARSFGGREGTRPSKTWKTFNLTALCVLLLAIFGSRSISAILALGIGIAVFARLQGIDYRKVGLSAGLLAIGGFLIFPKYAVALSHKVMVILDNFRAQIWHTSFLAFRENPLFGWGLGNFELAYEAHKVPIDALIGRYAKTTIFAHSEPVQILVELGIAGLAGAGALVIAFAYSALASSSMSEPRVRLNGIGNEYAWSVSCLAIFTVQALVDFNLRLPVLGMLFAFFCAQLVSARGSYSRAKMPRAALHVLIAALILAQFSALAFIKFGQPARSETALLQNIRLDPMNAHTHAELAVFYYESKKYDESLREYLAASQRSPKNPFYLAQAGDIYIVQNRLEIARECYVQAARLEPFYKFAHYRIGEIDLARGNAAAAKNAFEGVVKIHEFSLSKIQNSMSDYERRLLDFDHNLAVEKLKRINSSGRKRS